MAEGQACKCLKSRQPRKRKAKRGEADERAAGELRRHSILAACRLRRVSDILLLFGNGVLVLVLRQQQQPATNTTQRQARGRACLVLVPLFAPPFTAGFGRPFELLPPCACAFWAERKRGIGRRARMNARLCMAQPQCYPFYTRSCPYHQRHISPAVMLIRVSSGHSSMRGSSRAHAFALDCKFSTVCCSRKKAAAFRP